MSLLTINKLTDTSAPKSPASTPTGWLADDSIGDAVLDALEDNGVLVFRGLHLDPEAQVAFCRRLGEIDHSSDGHHPVPGIYPITLDKSKNAVGRLPARHLRLAHRRLHPADDECPQKATVLSAPRGRRAGRRDRFANSYAAYDALTDDEKERFGSLRVVHSLEASQRRVTPDPTPEQLARWRSRPTHEHPLVWTHRSGRKSLVLGASADHVVGMDLEEGRALLDDCSTARRLPDKVYRHDWSVGDTVIWDNRGVLHRAAPYDRTRRARCCAPPCSATSRSSKD